MSKNIYAHANGLVKFDQTAKGMLSPVGVVIHYTASGSNLNADVDFLISKDLGYHLFIRRDGQIMQMTSIDQKCNHAGRAVWSGQSPNQSFLAVSLVSWGFLRPIKEGGFESYSGVKIPDDEIAMRPHNITGMVDAWHKATDLQLESLLKVLRHLIATKNIHPQMVCGHDECALPPGRKSDPGGVLPWTMSELRAMLKIEPKLA